MAAPGSAADFADGFRLVTSKKRGKRQTTRSGGAVVNRGRTEHDGEDDSIDVNKLERTILTAKEELRCTEFFSTVKDIFRHIRSGDWKSLCVSVTSDSKCQRRKSGDCPVEQSNASPAKDLHDKLEFDAIVCYGLGRFSSCVTARYQLGLMLLLRELLDVGGSCYVYDPLFSSEEKQVLTTLGWQLIDKNEEGKRPVDRTTLFFMPHCGKPLYNNLLWANWGARLNNVVLLGNSLSNIALRFPSKDLQKAAFYLHSILDCTKEFPLPNTFHFQDVFNDMSLHLFPVTDTLPPPLLWQQAEEPVYDLDWQEEIIRNSDT